MRRQCINTTYHLIIIIYIICDYTCIYMHMWPINNVGLHIYIHIYEKAHSAHCTVLRDADTTKTKNRQNKNKRVEISPGVSEHETQT